MFLSTAPDIYQSSQTSPPKPRTNEGNHGRYIMFYPLLQEEGGSPGPSSRVADSEREAHPGNLAETANDAQQDGRMR